MEAFCQPLSVNLVWHQSADDTLRPLIDHVLSLLQREPSRPFSRALNLPVFCYNSAEAPTSATQDNASRKLTFVFLEKNVTASVTWREYLGGTFDGQVIPIAVDSTAYNLSAILGNINFLRLVDALHGYSKEWLFIAMAHEIYRFACNRADNGCSPGSAYALKLFLSHAKNDTWAVDMAKAIKSYIDSHSQMKSFFDARDIAVAYQFDAEIEHSIRESTLISLYSDSYSSRYWCQREVMSARKANRPIIVVDCLKDYEDRRFPYSVNTPVVHINAQASVSDHEVLKILSHALLETLRHSYHIDCLEQCKSCGWLPANSISLARPPEIADVLISAKRQADGTLVISDSPIVYPEPPVYPEELHLFDKIGVQVVTPLTYGFRSLQNRSIGISISTPTFSDLRHHGLLESSLLSLAQDLCRHLLAREAVIVYGGDIRKSGYTEIMLNEACVLRDRVRNGLPRIRSFLAWPIYNKNVDEMTLFEANYAEILSFERCAPPDDCISSGISTCDYLEPDSTQNRYFWGRSLTSMRHELATACEARICAGGALQGYKGLLPGVLEECTTALQDGLPVYVLGGFSGVSRIIGSVLTSRRIPEELTSDWHSRRDPHYGPLLDYYGRSGFSGDPFSKVQDVLLSTSLSSLSKSNGLSIEENEFLIQTRYPHEALYLVLKGLTNILSTGACSS